MAISDYAIPNELTEEQKVRAQTVADMFVLHYKNAHERMVYTRETLGEMFVRYAFQHAGFLTVKEIAYACRCIECDITTTQPRGVSV